jgi:hypothetical protein
VISQHGGRLVEKFGDFFIGTVGEDFGQQVGVIAAAGGDELLFHRGTLGMSALPGLGALMDGRKYVVLFFRHDIYLSAGKLLVDNARLRRAGQERRQVR